jgi:hypothetical protein
VLELADVFKESLEAQFGLVEVMQVCNNLVMLVLSFAF